MKKRIKFIVLISLFMITSTSYAFSDIENHWAEDTIEKFDEFNILKGYGDDTFKPNSFMTRAEVATVINRMIGTAYESSKYIPDIKRDDWYYSEIRKAVKDGFMLGDENGYTNPEKNITREEAVVMIARAFNIDTISSFNINYYSDSSNISEWSKNIINTFIKYQYINGYEDNTIKPKNNITRAEFITIIDRIFEVIAYDNSINNGIVSGNMIVIGKNVALNNIMVSGNLIISEGIKDTLVLNNVEVMGNLILKEKFDNTIIVQGKTFNKEDIEKFSQYKNDEYGIEFSIPSDANVFEKWKEKSIDYSVPNLLVVDIEQFDDYYFKSIDSIAKIKLREVDNLYSLVEKR